MRVFLTGGTGFIGGHVAAKLRARGDEVIAFVRSEARATALQGLGCELAQGDITDSFSIERSMRNIDAVVHLAGRYQIGIPKMSCAAMQDVNIGGVRHVLDAAQQAEIPKIVYASTVNVFGDTKGQRPTESFRRNPLAGFLSCYDESKYRAHVMVEDRTNKGAPIVIVQPGAVYGPRDHSEIGNQFLLAAKGELRALVLTDLGLTLAYVEDVAEGFVRALDDGQIGQTYLLGGESVRMLDVLQKCASLAGRQLPRHEVSTRTLKLIAPLAPWIAPRLGYPANLKEAIRAGDGVTYWCDDSKARAELGYSPRSLDDGLRDMLVASGVRLAV